jgi:hypothetical protein
MKTGTKSLLFGVHQFIWHPIVVAVAWRRLYGEWPGFYEAICIFVHDWGYWGCAEMDGPQGAQHPLLGAKIAARLLGQDYERLVLLHSRTTSKSFGLEPSRLCWPDKYSIVVEPRWFYMLRARLSGELTEYHTNSQRNGFIEEGQPPEAWLDKLRLYEETNPLGARLMAKTCP